MISASDARKLVASNKQKRDSMLLRIETQIQTACKKGETTVDYELPFEEWVEEISEKITTAGYTVEALNKTLTINWAQADR